MTTYKDIIDMIQAFAANHPQINTFYSGKTWDFEANENMYPTLVCLPTASTIKKNELVITFNIISADILQEDKANLDFIYSNMLLIQTDIFSYLNNNDEDLNYSIYDDGFSIEPFQEDFTDVLAGWISTVDIHIPFRANNCTMVLN